MIDPPPNILGSLKPDAMDDMELVEAVLHKDRKATAEFIRLHADSVYCYVRRRLIPRSDLADDLVQEVFLAAWEDLRNYRGTSSLRSWLLGIARHKVGDYYRARLRDPQSLLETDEYFRLARRSDAACDGAQERGDLEDKTRQVLASLPETYSVALLWRYWEKRSAREIAAQTGKTEKAVERLLARARKQFKRRWNCE